MASREDSPREGVFEEFRSYDYGSTDRLYELWIDGRLVDVYHSAEGARMAYRRALGLVQLASNGIPV